jgi:hypothetical protein
MAFGRICLDGLDKGNDYHGSTHLFEDQFFLAREGVSYALLHRLVPSSFALKIAVQPGFAHMCLSSYRTSAM